MIRDKIVKTAETLLTSLHSFRFKYDNNKGYYKANGLDDYIPFCKNAGGKSNKSARSTSLSNESQIEIIDLSDHLIDGTFNYLVDKTYEYMVFFIWGEESENELYYLSRDKRNNSYYDKISNQTFYRKFVTDDQYVSYQGPISNSSVWFFRNVYYCCYYFATKNNRIIIEKIPEEFDKCYLYGITAGTNLRIFDKLHRHGSTTDGYPYNMNYGYYNLNEYTIDFNYANRYKHHGYVPRAVECFAESGNDKEDFNLYWNGEIITENVLTMKTKDRIAKYHIHLFPKEGDVFSSDVKPYKSKPTDSTSYYFMDYVSLIKGCY